MRVLHVLGELQASGAEVMLRTAADELARSSVETFVLSTGRNEGPFANELRKAGAEVLHLHFSRSLAFAMRFVGLLRTHRPDVVHIHTERANAALGLLARISGVPRVVRTVHSVFTYEGRLRRVRTVERALLRTIGVEHISVSPSVERNESERLGNPSILVENWIAPHFRPPTAVERDAARRSFGVRDDELVVSSIGRCVALKNHASVIRALPLIERATGRKVIYLHAGSGPEEHAERQAAASTLIAGDTTFLGMVASDKVRNLLWASDIYAMPSSYEGLGIAALEALACGVPAVLGDCAGLRDVAPESAWVTFRGTGASEIAEGVVDLVAHAGNSRSALEDLGARLLERHSCRLAVGKLLAIYAGDKE